MKKMQKVVLITGGSSGIGKAIGLYLTEKNYIVYGTSRNPKNYTDSPFPLLTMDVTDTESIRTCMAALLKREHRLDVLVNNAGVGITGALEEIPEQQIKRNFETNFFGPINVIKAVLPTMRAQQSGLIINITSIAGYFGLPFRGVYSASKGALNILTETFRMELKSFNIKMTTLAPGDFATNIAAGRYHAPVLDQSPYKESYSAILKSIDNDVHKGDNPLLVAQKVYHIIQVKNPKPHYKVGAFMQKFSTFLKRILPGQWFERILLNHHHL